MEQYEINKWIDDVNRKINDLERVINIEKLNEKLKELSIEMQDPNYWNNPDRARVVNKEANQIETKISRFNHLKQTYVNITELLEMTGADDLAVIVDEINNFNANIEEFEIEILLSDEFDSSNVILELHSGAGGTESQDWCEMLYRMYTRYAQLKGYSTEVLNIQQGDEAGLKSVTLKIKGDYAFGYLKSEKGIHRLVRISPFDSNKRRHTSFVSCEVTPELDADLNIELKDEELKVDVYRSGGAGGQSVNTTDSAVRITHLPTGIVVTCQNERSQIKNREEAMSILKTKLYIRAAEEKKAKLQSLKGEQKDIAWGSQIRSYVFHPYQMVKDHRTNYETSQVEDVMDGKIDGFINSYLKMGE